MGEVLFLAHRVPFPPDRGDKIRSHHLLKALAKLGPVHVGTFGETKQDMAQRPELVTIAKTHALIERAKPLPLAGAEALVKGRPVSLTAFDHEAMRRYVAKTLGNHRIETIFVFSGQMGQYIPDRFAGRVVIDLCDVDSAKFEAYADAGQRRWLNRREGALLALEEERLARRADRLLLISENEVDLFRSRLSASTKADLYALGNGIDAQFFDPVQVGLQADLEEGEDPQLVFTGQMDYPPNIAAVGWMIENVMPTLRKTYPRARFHVVGRAPVQSIRDHHGENGVRVWGEVPDVRPFLKSADVVVAPLLIARGVQNKVLEAMAMAKPVVVTPGAATGIDAVDGVHFAIAEPEPAATLDRIEALLSDDEKRLGMGKAARQFVVERMNWDRIYIRLAQLLDGSESGRDAA
ncbi:TIGR03087 family PEP-CTERM/XrtA system glycosyltransferase [Qipengyuania sp. 6D47A]|uniref:TIGR03087 family PEP-CTERM/XrtA system glycosyltransferase n=2 Tax=Qipengyuania qiaonensis TaxID=2867240 RepID=A0ABS7J695_9SPHN|nr:TIGR03087 family PEP-CTERM/XrtA system glycosyltransferase [Qipengyuania qiaonensis]MBX7481153.1 TIGR03087 family PEP-CTERM/XrtA system glycosyltransferase [Qipengyuania qiaonensis]